MHAAARTACGPQPHRGRRRPVRDDGDRLPRAEIDAESAAGAAPGTDAIGDRCALAIAEQLQRPVGTGPYAGVATLAAARIEQRDPRVQRSDPPLLPGYRDAAQEASPARIDAMRSGQCPLELLRRQDLEAEDGRSPAAQEAAETIQVLSQARQSVVARTGVAGGSSHHQQPHALAVEAGEIRQADRPQAGHPRFFRPTHPCTGDKRRRASLMFGENDGCRHLERRLGTDRGTEAAAVAAILVESYAPFVEPQSIAIADGDTGYAAGGEMTVVQTTFATEPRWRITGRRVDRHRRSYHPGATPGRYGPSHGDVRIGRRPPGGLRRISPVTAVSRSRSSSA